MRETKFRAYDKMNSRWIDLYTIRFSKDGAIIAVTDIDGEMYGLHQIELQIYNGWFWRKIGG